MTTGLLTTTAGRNAIIADLSGGADLVLTHVAWGDANGVPYNPNDAQVALVNEKYRATIANVAVVGGAIVVDAVIPTDTNDGAGRPSHGFSVAEVGLFSSTGTLIGLARCGNGYKPPPSSGQVHDVTYRLKLAVANPSTITVVIDPVAQVNVGRHVRPFWLTVDGVLNDPPAAPAARSTYVIGAAPTGAWAGFAGRLAQWVGVWALATVPDGHVVSDRSKGANDPLRYRRFDGAAWVSAAASEAAYGVTQLATLGETILGVEAGKAVTPANLREWAAPRERRPGFSVVDGVFNAPPPAPAEYTSVLVGPAPTGAFALSANQLATFFAGGWRFLEVPIGHILVNASQAEGSPGHFLRRVTGGTWVNAEASETAYGPARLASSAEALAAAADRVLTAQRADEVFARRLRNISAGIGLTGGGNLTADRSLAVDLAMLDARYTINGPLVAAMVFNTGASVWGGVQVVSGTPYGGTWNQATNTFTFTTPRPNTSYFIEGNVQASRFVENGTTNEHVPVVEPLETGDIATKTVNSFTMSAPTAVGTDSSNKRRLRIFYFLRVYGYS